MKIGRWRMKWKKTGGVTLKETAGEVEGEQGKMGRECIRLNGGNKFRSENQTG